MVLSIPQVDARIQFDPNLLKEQSAGTNPNSRNPSRYALSKKIRADLHKFTRIHKTFQQKVRELRAEEQNLLKKEGKVVDSLDGEDLKNKLIELRAQQKSDKLEDTLFYFRKIRFDGEGEGKKSGILAPFAQDISEKIRSSKIDASRILNRNSQLNTKIQGLLQMAETITQALQEYIQNQIQKYFELLKVDAPPAIELLPTLEVKNKRKELLREEIKRKFPDTELPANLGEMDIPQMMKIFADLKEVEGLQESINIRLKHRMDPEDVAAHFAILVSKNYSRDNMKEIRALHSQVDNIFSILEQRKNMEQFGIPLSKILSIPMNDQIGENLRAVKASALQLKSLIAIAQRSNPNLLKAAEEVDYTTPEGRKQISFMSEMEILKNNLLDKISALPSQVKIMGEVPYNEKGMQFLQTLEKFSSRDLKIVLDRFNGIHRILSPLSSPGKEFEKVMLKIRGENAALESSKAFAQAKKSKDTAKKAESLIEELRSRGIEVSTLKEHLESKTGGADYAFIFDIAFAATSKLANEGVRSSQRHINRMVEHIRSRDEVEKILLAHPDSDIPPKGDKSATEYLAHLQNWQIFNSLKEEIRKNGTITVDDVNFSDSNLAQLTKIKEGLAQYKEIREFFASKNIEVVDQKFAFGGLQSPLEELKKTKELYLLKAKQVEKASGEQKMTLDELKGLLLKLEEYDEVVSLEKDLKREITPRGNFLAKSREEIQIFTSTLRSKVRELENIKKVLDNLKAEGIRVDKFTVSAQGLKELEEILEWKKDVDMKLENQVDVLEMARNLFFKQMGILKEIIELQKTLIEAKKEELEKARAHIATLNSIMPVKSDPDTKTTLPSNIEDFFDDRNLPEADDTSNKMTQTQVRSNIETLRGYVEKKNSEMQMLMQEFDHINRVRLENPDFIASIVTLFYQSSIFTVQNF